MLIYALQIGYGSKLRNHIVNKTKEYILTCIQSTQCQCIGWDLFGLVILKGAVETMHSIHKGSNFNVLFTFDRIITCQKTMDFVGYIASSGRIISTFNTDRDIDKILLSYFALGRENALIQYNLAKSNVAQILKRPVHGLKKSDSWFYCTCIYCWRLDRSN